MKSIDSLHSLAYKPYRRLFIGSTISNIGTWVETTVVGIYMESQTRNPTYVALALAAAYVPQSVMGFFGGTIADRFSRKAVLVITNFVAGLIAALLTVGIARDFASPVFVISLVFLTGFMNAVAFPAWQGFIDDILPKEKVAGALSLMFAQWNLGRIIGPAIAALLISTGHTVLPLALNSGSFFVSIAVILLVKKHHYQDHAHVPTKIEKGNFKETTLAGWKYILNKESGMRNTYLVYLVAVFFSSYFIALMPSVAHEVFNNRNTGTALFIIGQGLGGVITSVVMTTLHIKYGQTKIQVAYLYILPASLILFGLSPNLYVAVPFVVVYGAAYVGTLTSTTLACQLNAPPAIKGRVSAAYMATLGAVFFVSSQWHALVMKLTNGRAIFILSGILLVIGVACLGAYSRKYELPEPYNSQDSVDKLDVTDIAAMGHET